MKTLLTILSLLFCGLLLQAQPAMLPGQEELPGGWKKNLKMGDEEFANGNYYQAARHYEVVVEKKDKEAEYYLKLGDAYRFSRQYAPAAEAYKEVINLDVTSYPLARLFYGNMLKQAGQYESAKREYEIFIDNFIGEDEFGSKEKAQKELKGCDLALTAEADDKELQQWGLISLWEDQVTAPRVLSEGKLMYTYRTPVSSKIYAAEFADLYSSQPMSDAINDEAFQNMQGTYGSAGNYFYFSRCLMVEGELVCQLYRSEKGKNIFYSAERMDIVNEAGYSSKDPFVSQIDGKDYLFFSSNRPGGDGFFDLYCAELGSDGRAVKLHYLDGVNTRFNEVSPFYDADAKHLYFSSDGLAGYGGYDIFRSEGVIGEWAFPENILAPYNSGADDTYFCYKGEEGYLASNRDHLNERIYKFHKDVFRVVGCVFCRGKKVTDLHVTLYEQTGDVQKEFAKALVPEQACTDVIPFSFDFVLKPNREYSLVAEKEGYMHDGVPITTVDLEPYYMELDLEMIPILKLAGDVFDGADSLGGKLAFANVGLYEDTKDGLQEVQSLKTIPGQKGFNFLIAVDKYYTLAISKQGYFPQYKNLKTFSYREPVTIEEKATLEPILMDKAYPLNVYYEPDATQPDPVSKKAIDDFVALLKANDKMIAEVVSYSTNAEEYIPDLTEERSIALRDMLIDKGINAERLTLPKDFGKLDSDIDQVLFTITGTLEAEEE